MKDFAVGAVGMAVTIVAAMVLGANGVQDPIYVASAGYGIGIMTVLIANMI